MTTISPKDKLSFEKISANSITELALIVPVSYNDSTLSLVPKINQINTVEVEIKSIIRQSKILKITATAWDSEVNLIIFNPKRFHFGIFQVNLSCFVQAKVEYNFGKIHLIQPKIINEINKIVPVYKTALQQKTMLKLMGDYLNIENLIQEGLDFKNAKILYDFHNPVKNQNYEDTFKNALQTLKYVEIFNFLIKLNTKKRYFQASAVLNGDDSAFIKSLPFILTSDQQKAIHDIKKDLANSIATKRVIVGDVGSGKTIIIFAACMIAYPKKSILMVPTTILAKQIYEEANKYLPSHARITLVASKDKKLKLDEFDFIIGTHVLLYRDLPKCDLVMIDEQHRFGTLQRDMISKMVSKESTHPHFLQFSATPIPRTLTLINSSLVDYSFIKETPFKKDISTYVISKDSFKKMIVHIEKEIKEHRQVAIIYPLVEESEKLEYQSIEEGRGFWEKRYKSVYVTFGKDKQKEQILEDFRDNGNILIATTVVEVGISLPRLSTIIIVGAERLGLATLHQLRGRVSRNGLKGYCFLYTNNKNNKRLIEFSKTNSGFDIAELDLKYRQSGDIISGLSQHGTQFKWFDMKEDESILAKAKNTITKLNI